MILFTLKALRSTMVRDHIYNDNSILGLIDNWNVARLFLARLRSLCFVEISEIPPVLPDFTRLEELSLYRTQSAENYDFSKIVTLKQLELVGCGIRQLCKTMIDLPNLFSNLAKIAVAQSWFL